MKKGITLFQSNGRWRGIMPFRMRKPLESERRTGEPSPTLTSWYPEGYGKARGSFTKKMRDALYAWMEANGFSYYSEPLTFEYRLYRHRNVTVTGLYPYIKHSPSYGRGKKGFILQLSVLSIDGVPCRFLFGRRAHFAWDRIIGRDKLLALTEAVKGGKP